MSALQIGSGVMVDRNSPLIECGILLVGAIIINIVTIELSYISWAFVANMF